MKTKQQMIEQYSKKSVEWLAKYHAQAIIALNEREEEANRLRMEKYGLEYLKEVNENLAKVLQENGIRPVKLRVKYRLRDCEKCAYGEWDGDDYSCGEPVKSHEGECEYKEIIQNVAFYTYRIGDDWLTGIISDFRSAEYDVLSVTDERTGKVIYEYQEDEEEGDES